MTDDSTEEYEREYSASASQAGDLLRKLGDCVAGGGVRLGGEAGATLEFPDRMDVEIDVETEGGERELEVELAWPLDGADERAQVDEPTGPETGGSADESATSAADQETADSAAETSMPTDPVEAIAPLGTGVGGTGAEPGGRARFELFRDGADEWRWRLVHDNGNVIADSGEGYTRKENARKGLRSVMANAPGAPVVEGRD